jgi:hypothetical protein
MAVTPPAYPGPAAGTTASGFCGQISPPGGFPYRTPNLHSTTISPEDPVMRTIPPVPTDPDGEYDAVAIHRWEGEGGTVRAERQVDSALEGGGDAHRPGPAIGPSGTPARKRDVSLNRKAGVVAKPVYPTLAAHQAAESDWEYQPIYVLLEEWFERFNARFRLNLPRVPLRLDRSIRRNCAGYFLADHNEFGLVYEIAVAVPPPDRLDVIDRGDLLGTLLHEQIHLLQELTGIPGKGKNNYHNAQYRATVERFGLLVDYRGHQKYSTDSPFLDVLAEHGVEPPFAVQVERAVQLGQIPPPLPTRGKPPGKSKLRKWWCGCTNVRVGVAEFHAKCTRPECGGVFRLC